MIFIPSLSLAQDRSLLLKTGFVAKFAQFTAWPEDYSPYSENIVITVLGDDPIFDAMNKFYINKKIKGFQIKIKQIFNINEIDSPHILFITKNMKSELNTILEYIQNKPIMTISDTEGFCNKGVLINFYLTKKGTLHFELNYKVMRQSNLKINLLLLEIAKVIK